MAKKDDSVIRELLVDENGNHRWRSDAGKHQSFKRVGTNYVVYTSQKNKNRVLYKIMFRGTNQELDVYMKNLQTLTLKRMYQNYC